MEKQINELAVLLEKEKTLKEEYALRYEVFQDETTYLSSQLQETKDQIDQSKIFIKEQAKIHYTVTNEKKMYGGIGIRVGKKLEYNSEKAFNFAKEKDMFLMLDKKAFEKVAAGLKLDFVEELNNVIVTFPKEIKISQ